MALMARALRHQLYRAGATVALLALSACGADPETSPKSPAKEIAKPSTNSPAKSPAKSTAVGAAASPAGPTVLLGAFAEVAPNLADVQEAARFAVQTRAVQGKRRIIYQDVLHAEQQVVAGVNYKLRLQVMEGGQAKLVTVLVWHQLDGGYQLTEWAGD